MSQHHRSNREDKNLTVKYRLYCEIKHLDCWICETPIDYSISSASMHPDSFQRDHFYPASTHPELYADWDNFRPSHARCNASRGNRPVERGLGPVVEAWWGD